MFIIIKHVKHPLYCECSLPLPCRDRQVGSQLPTSGGLPMPSPDEPAGPVEKSPGLAEPVSQSQSVAPNENQSRSDKDPDASSEGGTLSVFMLFL